MKCIYKFVPRATGKHLGFFNALSITYICSMRGCTMESIYMSKKRDVSTKASLVKFSD